jgi:hypothetical protein
MKLDIISKLKTSKNNIELDYLGNYDNQEEELNLEFSSGYFFTLVFRIECISNELDLIEFIECSDGCGNHIDFNNRQVSEIEKIINNITEFEGGTSEDVEFYDPQECGDTL